jgi:hypothetical protein
MQRERRQTPAALDLRLRDAALFHGCADQPFRSLVQFIAGRIHESVSALELLSPLRGRVHLICS